MRGETKFFPKISNRQFTEGQKSKGILDDFPIRQNIDTAEGTINHTPTAAKHIVNKEYVDSVAGAPKLNEVENPDASKTFALGNNKFLTFTSVDRTPIAGEGIFNWETQGNFTGDLAHFHQHTGNAGTDTILVHIEGEDTDVTPLTTTKIGVGSKFSVNLDGNIWTEGTVDGVDIAAEKTRLDTISGAGLVVSGAYVTTSGVTFAGSVAAQVVSGASLRNDAGDSGVGLFLTQHNETVDIAFVPMVLYNTDDTPPTATGYPSGTLYVQYTA